MTLEALKEKNREAGSPVKTLNILDYIYKPSESATTSAKKSIDESFSKSTPKSIDLRSPVQ